MLLPGRGNAGAVRAAIAQRETVTACADWVRDKVWIGTGLLEVCALAAEQAGDADELCDFYAAESHRQYTCKPFVRASCLALLGRVAVRRGDRPGAEAHWREAATLLLETRCPMQLLRVCEDWGGGAAFLARLEQGQQPAHHAGEEEPARLLAEACAVVGRPVREVLREFREAREEGDCGGGGDDD